MVMRLKTCGGALGLAGLFALLAIAALFAPRLVRSSVNDGIRKCAREQREEAET